MWWRRGIGCSDRQRPCDSAKCQVLVSLRLRATATEPCQSVYSTVKLRVEAFFFFRDVTSLKETISQFLLCLVEVFWRRSHCTAWALGGQKTSKENSARPISKEFSRVVSRAEQSRASQLCYTHTHTRQSHHQPSQHHSRHFIFNHFDSIPSFPIYIPSLRLKPHSGLTPACLPASYESTSAVLGPTSYRTLDKV